MKNADNCNKSLTQSDARRKLQECELVHKNIIYEGESTGLRAPLSKPRPKKWRLMMNAIAAICYYYYGQQKQENVSQRKLGGYGKKLGGALKKL